MVARERINSTCTVFIMNTKYYARENCCGGFNSGAKDTVKEAVDYAIGQLAASGGSIFLKNIPLPGDVVSYGSHILIVADWKDGEGNWQRKFYSNDKCIDRVGDCPEKVSGTHTHANNTSEQQIFEWIPTVLGELFNADFNFEPLTKGATLRFYKKVNDAAYTLITNMVYSVTPTNKVVVVKADQKLTALKATLQSDEAEGASRDIKWDYYKEDWS